MGLFRVIGYLIAAVLTITVLRSIIGALLKMVSALFRPPAPAGPARPSPESLGGALKKDPVCGTFIAESAAIQKSVSGTTHYFCSVECRDKFQA